MASTEILIHKDLSSSFLSDVYPDVKELPLLHDILCLATEYLCETKYRKNCYKGSMVNEKKYGIWTWKDKKGLTVECSYKNGYKHGKYVEKWSDGSNHEILCEGEYENGEKNGRWTSQKNNLIIECSYKNGYKHGSYVERYMNNKKISSEGVYKKGEKHGVFICYRMDGSIWTKNQY